jgi:hypothetical protein
MACETMSLAGLCGVKLDTHGWGVCFLIYISDNFFLLLSHSVGLENA